MTTYKRGEIEAHFFDYLNENFSSIDKTADEERLIIDHEPMDQSDLHHEIFNTDYYIIGTYQATQWLGDHAFEVINIIKEYEQFHFGEVSTDFSDPERIVNMYAYIVGEQVINDWVESLENAEPSKVIPHYVHWYRNGENRDIWGIENLRKEAARFGFCADTLIGSREIVFDRDDGNGAYGGVFLADWEAPKPFAPIAK